MTPRRLPFLVLALSLAVIGGALYFQYAVGLVPCELCLKERLPWYAGIVLSALVIVMRARALDRPAAALFTLLFIASGALGLYHVGVERHLVAGPAACTGAALTGLSLKAATQALFATPPVRCDTIQWSLAGISLAGWNAFLSFLLAAAAFVAFCRRPGRPSRFR